MAVNGVNRASAAAALSLPPSTAMMVTSCFHSNPPLSMNASPRPDHLQFFPGVENPSSPSVPPSVLLESLISKKQQLSGSSRLRNSEIRTLAHRIRISDEDRKVQLVNSLLNIVPKFRNLTRSKFLRKLAKGVDAEEGREVSLTTPTSNTPLNAGLVANVILSHLEAGTDPLWVAVSYVTPPVGEESKEVTFGIRRSLLSLKKGTVKHAKEVAYSIYKEMVSGVAVVCSCRRPTSSLPRSLARSLTNYLYVCIACT